MADLDKDGMPDLIELRVDHRPPDPIKDFMGSVQSWTPTEMSQEACGSVGIASERNVTDAV